MTAKVCVIATVRADVRDTIGFVNYHLNSGIEEIILFLDDPADPAAQQLSGYADVRPIRCDAAYWAARGVEAPSVTQERQEINVNHGMKLAAERGFDWIIHIDGDELLLADGDINTILSEQSADVVRFELKEAVAEKDRYETILRPRCSEKAYGRRNYTEWLWLIFRAVRRPFSRANISAAIPRRRSQSG